MYNIRQDYIFSPDTGYAIGIAVTELIQNNIPNAIGDTLSTQNNVSIVDVVRIQDVIQ